VRAPNAAVSGRPRLYGALGTGALLGGGLAYVGLADPHNPDFVFPACPFKLLTGWNCPACGGLRMTHDLLHGDLAAAAVAPGRKLGSSSGRTGSVGAGSIESCLLRHLSSSGSSRLD